MPSKKKNSFESLDTIIPLCAIVAFVLFSIGLKNIDKYSDWISLSFLTVIASFFFATILYFILDSYLPGIGAYKNFNNIKFYPQLLVLTTFSFFGLGQIINEAVPISKMCNSYSIVGKKIRGSRHKDYRILIFGKNGLEELSYGKSFYDSHQEGDRINLCVIKGVFGYEYYELESEKCLDC